MRFTWISCLLALAVGISPFGCSGSGSERHVDASLAGPGDASRGHGGTSGGAGGGGGSGGAGTAGTPGTGGSQATGGSPGKSDAAQEDVAARGPDGATLDGRGQGGTSGTGGQGNGGRAIVDGAPVATGGARGACAPPAGYRNLFSEFLGKSQDEVDAKLDTMVQQLFHGKDDQKIYYELGSDKAQIYDTGSGDVRSEGQSYGMMMAVQMGMRTEFDKLWNYAASCMRQSNGSFTWSMQQGSCSAKQTGFAPDGEEYFAMALLLASRRWDTSTGIDYGAEAKKVMTAMATQLMFSKSPACVFFTMNSGNSDPSYVLPLFYSEWACFDADNAALWSDAVKHAQGTFFHNACNKSTGLAPEHCGLDGAPQDDFGPDAWRVPMNIMMDYNLNGTDVEWRASYAKTHAAFWVKEGLQSYGDRYSLAGEKKNPGHGPGLDGVNALLAFALPVGDANAKALVQRAWDVPLQTGQYRYYHGCLQVLSFMHASGRFSLFY